MPGQLSENRTRVSFAEDKVKVAAMKRIAVEKQVSFSKIIRNATALWLEKNDSSQSGATSEVQKVLNMAPDVEPEEYDKIK